MAEPVERDFYRIRVFGEKRWLQGRISPTFDYSMFDSIVPHTSRWNASAGLPKRYLFNRHRLRAVGVCPELIDVEN